MAFALRRQLSDSSRKRNGGANIRRKNRRYLAAGLTVFSLLFGGLQVWAAEKPDAGWETKIQKEEKSNMEILIASEQPYTYLSQMKERIQFVGALSPGELYQLQEIELIHEVVTDEKSEEIGYQPSMDINQLNVAVLLDRLDTYGSENFKIDKDEEFNDEWKVLTESREEYYKKASKVLLKDL